MQLRRTRRARHHPPQVTVLARVSLSPPSSSSSSHSFSEHHLHRPGRANACCLCEVAAKYCCPRCSRHTCRCEKEALADTLADKLACAHCVATCPPSSPEINHIHVPYQAWSAAKSISASLSARESASGPNLQPPKQTLTKTPLPATTAFWSRPAAWWATRSGRAPLQTPATIAESRYIVL